MIPALATAAGAGLILVALADTFLTVLYARSGVGLVSARIHEVAWRILVRALRGPSRRRQHLLSFAGPLMMILSVATWAGMLLLGSALIAWPLLGTGIQASQGETPTGFATALYFADYSLTTLGVGDLIPRSEAMRLFTVLLAFIGFPVVTLTLTYFMSVYSALVRRNVVSQTLHHLSGETGDAASVVAALGPGGTFDQGRSQIMSIATGVLDIVESNEAYPVLQYFRMNHAHYAVSRVALLTLESATLSRTALSSRYEDFIDSGSVKLLWGSGQSLLGDAEKSAFIWTPRAAGQAGEDGGANTLRASFDAAVATIRDARIETREDLDEAFAEYSRLRREWLPRVQALARCTGFDWHEISSPSEKDRQAAEA